MQLPPQQPTTQEREADHTRKEAATARFAHLSDFTKGKAIDEGSYYTDGSLTPDGWEVEYQAWLDRIEVESRIARGLRL
jgi:hypothetical protein